MKSLTAVILLVLVTLFSVGTVFVMQPDFRPKKAVNDTVITTGIDTPFGGLKSETENLSQDQAVELQKWQLNKIAWTAIVIVLIWKVADILKTLIQEGYLDNLISWLRG